MARVNVKGSHLYMLPYVSGSSFAALIAGASGTSGLFQSNYVVDMSYDESAITTEPTADWASLNAGETLTPINTGKKRTGSITFHEDTLNPYPLDTNNTYSMLLYNTISNKHLIAEYVVVTKWGVSDKIGEAESTGTFDYEIGAGLFHAGSGYPVSGS